MAGLVLGTRTGRGLLFSNRLRLGPCEYEIQGRDDGGAILIFGACRPDRDERLTADTPDPILELETKQRVKIRVSNFGQGGWVQFDVDDDASIAACDVLLRGLS